MIGHQWLISIDWTNEKSCLLHNDRLEKDATGWNDLIIEPIRNPKPVLHIDELTILTTYIKAKKIMNNDGAKMRLFSSVHVT